MVFQRRKDAGIRIMPKELHEIKKFLTGIITTPSETDIPDDAAAYSLNVDPVAEDGKLKGIPDDTCLKTDGTWGDSTLATVDASKMAMINNDGQRDVIYYEANTNKIHNITDFYVDNTSFAQNDMGAQTNSEDRCAMQVNNKEVHIGMGKGTDDKPLWAGIISHEQLDQGTPSGLQLKDAELKSPNSFTEFYKVVSDGTYIYGIKWQGQYVYKFKVSDGLLVRRSSAVFKKLQGLCVDINDDIWVYDRDVGTHGTVYKCSPEFIEKIQSNALSAGSANISDMTVIGTNIWISVYGEFGAGAQAACLYHGTLPTISGTLTVTQRGPWLGEEGASTSQAADVGNWIRSCKVMYRNGQASEGEAVKCLIPKVALFKTKNSVSGHGHWVGLLTYYFRDVDGENRRGQIATFLGGALTNTSINTNQLIDSGATFQDAVAHGGYYYIEDNAWNDQYCYVWNMTDGTRARLVSVDSDTTLTLDADIFTGTGKEYQIEREACLYYNYWSDIDGGRKERKQVRWAVTLIKNDYTGGYFSEASAMVFPLSDGSGDSDENLYAFTFEGSLWASESSTHDYMYGVAVEQSEDRLVLSCRKDSQHVNSRGRLFDLPNIDRPFGDTASGSGSVADGEFDQYAGEKDITTTKSPLVVLDGAAANELDIYMFAGGSTEAGAWLKATYNVSTTSWGAISVIIQTILDLDISENGDTSSVFANGTKYYYKTSFLYDGYQESPLGDDFVDTNSGGENYDVVLYIRNISNLSSRVSHVNLYRAEGGSDTTPIGYYRLVKSIALDHTWIKSTDVHGEDYYEYTYVDIGTVGASYDALAGVSEAIDNTIINYSLSAQLNNSLFVCKGYHALIDDSENFLFKSKPYNFDQFDWSQDLLRLPTEPTALASFNGRIFAFDENNTYRIEPNNLYIEDTFEGVGCIGPDAICVTEYGTCLADKNNIYLHDGRQPIPIGNAILRGYTISWENKSSSFVPKVMFDAERNAFVIFMEVASSYYAWVYTLSRKRWDLWAASHPKGILSGKNGEMFISDGTNLIYYLGSTTETDNWTWQSKKLTMGTDTQDKIFKRTRITFSDSPSDCLDTVTTSSGTITGSNKVYADDSDNAKYTYSGDNRKGKWIQYTISDESVEVDAIGTIFRRRLAK
jgi:hypothetical protein